MFRWIPYVFVRYTLFFIGGILLGIYHGPLFSISAILTIALGGIALYGLGYVWLKHPRPRSWLGLLALPLFSLAGYAYLLSRSEKYNPNHLLSTEGSISHYVASVVEPAERKGKTWRLTAKVITGGSDENWIAVEGKVYLYLLHEEGMELPSYGDQLLIKGAPSELAPPANPYEFDYKRFLSFQNIFHQHFLPPDQWQIIGHAPSSQLMKMSFQVRHWARGVMEKYIDGERERDITLALVLGIKDGLDQDIKTSYSAAGAMHVLAVSGLHVGIVYGILLFFFGKLHAHSKGRWLLAALALLVLWFYAFVTGLSPSVLRAVTMFSFIILAKASGNTTNIYNTLAASAFLLLWLDPFLIMAVGFQLSYMAVFGIVFLQPILYRQWMFQGWLADKVWTITCVSLAAQAATFPLGLLYYHQFPTYFLFSNLVVIPAAFLILCLGLGLLALQALPLIGNILGFLLKWVVFGVNSAVVFVENLPSSQIKDVYITVPQTWCVIVALLMIILCVQYRQITYFYYTFVAVVLFSVSSLINKSTQFSRQEVVFYQVNGVQAIDFIKKGRVVSRMDSVLLSDANRWRFHVYPNRLVAGLSPSPKWLEAPPTRTLPFGDLVMWEGKSFLILHEPPANLSPVEVDYVVLSRNGKFNIRELTQQVGCKTLIIDSSNKYYLAGRWKKEAEELGIRVHSLPHQGALKITI
jgi:competence protein ComEC